MSDIELCRRPGTDCRTKEQKQEALLLTAFRLARRGEKFRMLRRAAKVVSRFVAV